MSQDTRPETDVHATARQPGSAAQPIDRRKAGSPAPNSGRAFKSGSKRSTSQAPSHSINSHSIPAPASSRTQPPLKHGGGGPPQRSRTMTPTGSARLPQAPGYHQPGHSPSASQGHNYRSRPSLYAAAPSGPQSAPMQFESPPHQGHSLAQFQPAYPTYSTQLPYATQQAGAPGQMVYVPSGVPAPHPQGVVYPHQQQENIPTIEPTAPVAAASAGLSSPAQPQQEHASAYYGYLPYPNPSYGTYYPHHQPNNAQVMPPMQQSFAAPAPTMYQYGPPLALVYPGPPGQTYTQPVWNKAQPQQQQHTAQPHHQRTADRHRTLHRAVASPRSSAQSPKLPVYGPGAHPTSADEASRSEPVMAEPLASPEMLPADQGLLGLSQLSVAAGNSAGIEANTPTAGTATSPNDRAPSSQRQRSGDQVRSEHVLWVGNVPSNATQDELWPFFSTLDGDTGGAPDAPASHGILSIFIIARSNCAFVNYATAQHLQRAVTFFNGKTLRPQDPRCLKLVCRIRKKDDVAQAGVAGQRNKGIHVAWHKDYTRRMREANERQQSSSQIGTGPVSSPSTSGQPSSSVTSPADEERGSSPPSLAPSGASIGSSGPSYTSTNSDLLRQPAFRSRYFILKSHDIKELDHAVEAKTWSTQPHNEPVLDQAYRNSEAVYLIFSANQSGSFYGYARMNGQIGPLREKTVTSGAPRTDSSDAPGPGAQGSEDRISTDNLLSPGQVAASPLDLTPAEETTEPAYTLPKQPAQPSSLPPTKEVRTDSDQEVRHASAPTSLVPSMAHEQSTAGYEELSEPQNSPPLEQALHEKLSVSNTPSGSHVSPESPPGDRVVRRDMASSLQAAPASGSDPLEGNSFSSLAPSDSASGDPLAASQLATRAIIHNLRLAQRDSQRKAEELEKQLLAEERFAASGEGRIRSEDGAQPTSSTLLPAPEAQNTGGSATPVLGEGPDELNTASFGRPFPIDWLQTRPLPFSVVKHLRNPWNEGKSIRVARDGTEVAVETGAELLRVWEAHAEECKKEATALAGDQSNRNDGSLSK